MSMLLSNARFIFSSSEQSPAFFSSSVAQALTLSFAHKVHHRLHHHSH